MEPTTYKPSIYNGAGFYKYGSGGIYNGSGGIYNGCGIYNDGSGEFVEIGGKKYPICKIGNLLWTTINLDLKWDSLIIGFSTSYSDSRADYYNSDENTNGWNGNKKNLLYNATAVNYIKNNYELLGITDGWHIPTRSEASNSLSTIASEQLKKLNSKTLWNPESFNGNNESGFDARPTGSWNGSFYSYDDMFTCWNVDDQSRIYKRRFYWGIVNTSVIYGHYEFYRGCCIRLCKTV